jgi:oxygen-independent coproporphyrinogen-3 oxidase
MIPEYSKALCIEIEVLSKISGQKLPVHTIFFGGGTPSLLPTKYLEQIFDCLIRNFIVERDAEITLEANPVALSFKYLQSLYQLGINRLSLGMQSSNFADLVFLERQHDFLDVIHSVFMARKAGFENINLDLIFGLPDQTLAIWQSNIKDALRLEPDHLSLYSLSIEPGTPMRKWLRRGMINSQNEDEMADMYEWVRNYLPGYGYRQYEISNWAKHQSEGGIYTCRHNLQYWRTLPYLGLGAGGHGYAKGLRVANVLSPIRYTQDLLDSEKVSAFLRTAERTSNIFPRSPMTQSVQRIDSKEAMGEMMMMGLRLVEEGVSRKRFRERFDIEMVEVYQREIESLVNHGLLEWRGEGDESLGLTDRGCLLGNRVFQEFI